MGYFKRIDCSILSIIRKIGKAADKQGKCIYLVGGIVRDLILDRPNLDIDLVLEGDACQFAKSIGPLFKASVKIYPKFGTATLVLNNGQGIDITSARSERYSYPGALPSIQKGKNLKEDLLRRDFTINAMAIAIHSVKFGELIDLYGSMEDLKKKKIRVLHDKSFEDDPTRILRGIRFEQRFNYRFEKKTLGLLKESIQNQYDRTVSLSRYFTEFKKLLKEKDPIRGLRRLSRLGALSFLNLKDPVSWKLLKDIQIDLNQRKSGQKQDFPIESWLFYLLGVTYSLRKSERQSLSLEFQLCKEEKRSWLETSDSEEMIASIKGFNNPSDVFQYLRKYSLSTTYFLKFLVRGLNLQKIMRYLEVDRFVQLKINGDDLQLLGVKLGSQIGRILTFVLNEKIDQGIKTKSQELKVAKKYIKEQL